MKARALTGIRPSGDIHVGNYLGTIKPAIKLQEKYHCLYFIADLHALTTMRDAKLLHDYSLDVAAAWIACGLNNKENIIYRQSDLPHTEYAWYLSCVTGIGLLEKAHAFKDAAAQQKDANHGIFAYPVLMAADILLYEPKFVPVGKDQKQHVEMARDMAGSFNAAFQKDCIALPEPLIDEKVMTIPGLDGRKMSKSYGNVIPIFCDEKSLRKKIMSIKTDSSDAEAPKDLKGTLVGDLFTLFGTPAEFSDLESRLKKGGMGWGHAKEELFVAVNRELAPLREEYTKLRNDTKTLEAILADGRAKAFEIASVNINKVRSACGLPKFPFILS